MALTSILTLLIFLFRRQRSNPSSVTYLYHATAVQNVTLILSLTINIKSLTVLIPNRKTEQIREAPL